MMLQNAPSMVENSPAVVPANSHRMIEKTKATCDVNISGNDNDNSSGNDNDNSSGSHSGNFGLGVGCYGKRPWKKINGYVNTVMAFISVPAGRRCLSRTRSWLVLIER